MAAAAGGMGQRFGLFGGRIPPQSYIPKTLQDLSRYFLPIDKLFFK